MGRAPLFKLTEAAVAYSVLRGDRPHRPNHHVISDAIWHIVERSWHGVLSQRMSIEKVVGLLAAEEQCVYDSILLENAAVGIRS